MDSLSNCLLLLLVTFKLHTLVDGDTSVSVRQYGVSVTLDCVTRHEGSFKHWVTPDLEVVSSNYTHPSRKVILLRENNSILIPAVDPAMVGDYLCAGENSNGKPVYGRATILFYYPPVWEAYYHNFVTAISSASVFLAVSSLFYFVHYYRSRRAIVALQVPTEGALVVAAVGTGTGNGVSLVCGGVTTTTVVEYEGDVKISPDGDTLKTHKMKELTYHEGAALQKTGEKDSHKALETLM